MSSGTDGPLLIVGGGRMGDALLTGLLAAGRPRDGLVVAEVSAARREELVAAHPGVTVSADIVPGADGAVLAVKPGDVARAARAVAEVDIRRVLSVAAGVRTASIEAAAGRALAVVRAMPNTPALIGAGAAAISPGSTADDDDMSWAEAILGAVGIVVRVPEAALDAVTGLSGSGPAYLFLVAEAMVDAAVLAGLPREVAEKLTFQTLLGSSRLLQEAGSTPSELRATVTSPGGTTAAGIRMLETRGVRAAFLDAVAAATERSRELGT